MVRRKVNLCPPLSTALAGDWSDGSFHAPFTGATSPLAYISLACGLCLPWIERHFLNSVGSPDAYHEGDIDQGGCQQRYYRSRHGIDLPQELQWGTCETVGKASWNFLIG